MMKENKWGGCSHEQAANSVYFAANFFGNAAFGPFADSFGRQKGMIFSLAVTAFGGSLSITGITFFWGWEGEGERVLALVSDCLWYSSIHERQFAQCNGV